MRPRGTGDRPPKGLIEDTVSEAVERFGVPDAQILSRQTPAALEARRWVWKSILLETGCSLNGLAEQWGCDRGAIWRWLKTLSKEDRDRIQATRELYTANHRPEKPKPKRRSTRTRGCFAPRIVALGMQGMTAFTISQFIGCSEPYAASVLTLWRAEGGQPLTPVKRRPPYRVLEPERTGRAA